MSDALASTIAALIDQLRDELRVALLADLRAEQQAAAWPAWMNVETAARYLDVSPERLRKLQARHAIPCHQQAPGCRVLFRRSDLDDWMTTHRQEARGKGHG